MSARELVGLQTALHAHLLNQPSSISEAVADGGRISVAHRLHIYHHAYRVRLLENLQDTYEKTWAYLGDARFEKSARDYIEHHPPQHRSLRWYGADFSAWLSAGFANDPDIGELAMLDWELRRAFDGPNATPVSAAALAGLSAENWETTGFQFAPTLFIAPLFYNTPGIWHALDQTQTPPTATAQPIPTWIAIWRRGWQPHFRTLLAPEHAALLQLQQGAAFSQVCNALSQQFSDAEAATVAAESLRTWLQDEWIVGFTDVT